MSATEGLSGAARRVADHARSLVQLEIQLAVAEVKRKVVSLAAGIGLAVGAAIFGLFALVFAVAAAAAALATAMAVWAALLVMFGILLVLAAILGVAAVTFLRKGSPPVPKQAIEEARLTTEALRNGR